MKASKLTPTTLTGLALVVALAAPLAAQNFPEEIDVMRRIAASFDTNNDDKIDRDEFREFTRLVWASMDSNNDGQVDEAEFMAWDPGFSYVAELNGKSEDFTSMKQEIFAYWDANAHHRDRLALEEPQPLAAGHPVDGVLEDAGDAVVVFRRGQQQPVGGRKLLLQALDRWRQARLRLFVGIVERHVADVADFDRDAGGRQLDRGAQEAGIEGRPAQAAGKTEDRRHAVSFFALTRGSGVSV